MTALAASVLGGLKGALRSREAAVAAVLVLVVVGTSLVQPGFLVSRSGWRDLLLTPAILVVLAVGQAMVVFTRNIDLSVGSVLGLTAYLTGRLFADGGLPIPVVVLVTVLAGAVLGLVNGAVVAFARVPALVVTLGTMYAYRGVVLTWAGSDRIDADEMPRAFGALGTRQVATIPVLAIVAVVVLAVAAWFMHTSRAGRQLYAIGSDPDAAHLHGLPVARRVLWVFVVSGALAGLGGAMFAARYGTVSSGAGSGLELQVVGAVVVGGVAIFGGSGTVVGAAIGAVLLLTINRALPVVGVPDFWQRAVVGVLILSAIVLDRVLAVRRTRRLVAARLDEHARFVAAAADQPAAGVEHARAGEGRAS
ncbi:Monosaccharide-transporting ATPase [Xylanimonas cellulosilytica DSM 15894]|uniref:Autoinducer 2 import system permease protein LsrC n=1 Tax=Xylanimonas cellulosilytica (strain DSM 15894 / JCM 12276 / CECT 5975 / KCTC 9989 / LMG 20990 / NBRC 107835 / XIL07) TaxID=446471 RepID=D1BY71_XYLCX|nr:ABC transporter permease [Xylanimonas cellulosilytica]ACZ29914.1 Monosaccharide-transporting ATPase [Xylanimonas cellulosilytica DSM 15894]